EIDKYKADPLFKDFFTDDFISKSNDYFSSISEAENLNNNEKENYITKEKNNIFTYNTNISNLNITHNNEIDLLLDVKKTKEDNVHNDLAIEVKNFNLRKELNKQALRKNLTKINNDIIVKKEMLAKDDLGLESSKKPNLDNYNYYISKFSTENKEEYQKIHSKISREIYNLKDANQNVTSHLKAENLDTMRHINSVKALTDVEKAKLDNDLLDYEVKLNDKINKITEKYSALKKQNEVQTNVEIEDLKTKIEAIEKSYAQVIKKINNEASKRLNQIDKSDEEASKNLSQKIMDERYFYNVKNKQDDERIRLLYEEASHLPIKERIKAKYSIRLQERKIKLEKNLKLSSIKKDEISLKRLNSINIYQKALLDIERKYQIQIKSLEENLERYPLLKKIKLSENEKQGFNTLLENLLNKEINNERLQTELLKLNRQSNFNIFDARQHIELANLSDVAEDYNLDQTLSKNVLNLILQTNQDKDDLAYKHFNNISLLNIEKNKHLNHLNTITISFYKELNNLYLRHFTNLKKLEQNNFININKENDRYDEESLKIYKELKSNELNKINTEIKYDNSLHDSLLNYKKVTEKYQIQERRRLESVELIQTELNEFCLFIKAIKEIYNPQFNKLLEVMISDKENVIPYKKYIFKIRDNIENLIKSFNSSIAKLIDTYVRLDTGSKYDTLRNNIEFSYQSRLEGISKETYLLQSTITNYQNGISTFYNHITEINVDMINDNKNFQNKNKQEKKEIRKRNLEYHDLINIWRNKINQNTTKIDGLAKSIRLLEKKAETYKKNRLRDLNKVRILERKDSIASISTIERLNRITNIYVDMTSEEATNFMINQIIYNDPKRKKFNSYKSKTDKAFDKMIMDYKRAITSYQNDLLISLSKIKNKNTKTYNKAKSNLLSQRDADFSLLEKESKALEKEFNNAFDDHTQALKEIESNYQNEIIKERTEYEIERSNILSRYNSSKEYFYSLFSSCEDLIKYSEDEYDQNIKELDLNQTEITNKYLNDISKIKKKNSDNRNIEVAKYQNEINIIPKYVQINTKEAILRTKTYNDSLDNENNSIRRNLKELTHNSKLEIEKYNIDIHKEKKNEFIKFKKACLELKKDNKIQLTAIEKEIKKQKDSFKI
ncbi:MAG: hypothetical protein K6G28_02905, partial [Acholeplasmatales bacterium]|nr:hypothetical protein [Acholeplasmatales bacterium]